MLLQQVSQCTHKRNTEARWRNRCCREKALSITYSECGSTALFIQHLMCMRHIILLPVECPAIPHFSTLSPKRKIFGKMLLNIKCVY
jgi:hypothetical protein